MITAYISLGGNMGGEERLFPHVLECIRKWPGIAVNAVSGIYRTEPQGDRDQPWFHNQVASLGCSNRTRPESLLAAMLNLENELGRVRDADRRFGPRRIDLDLLLFGDIVCTGEQVIVPHPRMTERAFVLVPLLEIAPDAVLPDGEPIACCLARLPYMLDGTTILQQPSAAC